MYHTLCTMSLCHGGQTATLATTMATHETQLTTNYCLCTKGPLPCGNSNTIMRMHAFRRKMATEGSAASLQPFLGLPLPTENEQMLQRSDVTSETLRNQTTVTLLAPTHACQGLTRWHCE